VSGLGRVFANIKTDETINIPRAVGAPTVTAKTRENTPPAPYTKGDPATVPVSGQPGANAPQPISTHKPTAVRAKFPTLVNTLGSNGLVTAHVVLPGMLMPPDSWKPVKLPGGWTIVATRFMQLGLAINGDVAMGYAWDSKNSQQAKPLVDAGIIEPNKDWGPKATELFDISFDVPKSLTPLVAVAR
jgi:hypothetical protein